MACVAVWLCVIFLYDGRLLFNPADISVMLCLYLFRKRVCIFGRDNFGVRASLLRYLYRGRRVAIYCISFLAVNLIKPSDLVIILNDLIYYFLLGF